MSVNKGQEVQNRGSEAELGEVRTDGGIAGRNGFSKSLLVLKQKPLFIHTSFDPFTTAFYKFMVMFYKLFAGATGGLCSCVFARAKLRLANQ